MRYPSTLITGSAARIASARQQRQRRHVLSQEHTFSLCSSPLDGYEIQPIIQKGPTEKGGQEVAYNAASRSSNATTTGDRGANPCPPFPQSSIICDTGGAVNAGATGSWVSAQAENLGSVLGTCGVAGGPRVCLCDAGARLCNDSPRPIDPAC
ncbi:hypothetical protein AAE478_008280 [Parahypoxylon ruwenzoriense]